MTLSEKLLSHVEQLITSEPEMRFRLIAIRDYLAYRCSRDETALWEHGNDEIY